MILIFIDENLYSEEFKDEYYEVVLTKLEKMGFSEVHKKSFFKKLKTFFPPDFFKNIDDPLKYFILMPYTKLLEVKNFVDVSSESKMKLACYKNNKNHKVFTPHFQKIYNAYSKVADSKKQNTTMRVRIAKELKITICPYCNRDYINCRDISFSGAQLDHFFPRDKYPFFSVCLYNLVPGCANCNRIKSAKNEPIISPFDVKSKKSVRFSYEFVQLDGVKIVIKALEEFQHNISLFKLQNAYEIHSADVQELLDKQKIYNETQNKEILEVLKRAGISPEALKQSIFGTKYSEEDLRNKSLGKLNNDIRDSLNID